MHRGVATGDYFAAINAERKYGPQQPNPTIPRLPRCLAASAFAPTRAINPLCEILHSCALRG